MGLWWYVMINYGWFEICLVLLFADLIGYLWLFMNIGGVLIWLCFGIINNMDMKKSVNHKANA